MNIEVNKVGGASLIGASEIRTLPRLVSEFKLPSLLVVSALKNQTNQLEILADYVSKKDTIQAEKIFHQIFNHHLKIALQLFPGTDQTVADMSWVFYDLYQAIDTLQMSDDPDFTYDQIVHRGEVVSALLVGGFLRSVGIKNVVVNATTILATDNSWKSAKVDMLETHERTRILFRESFWFEYPLVIMGGFIGQTIVNNQIVYTTLGREGSDKTAAIMAHLLGASRINFWKDQKGLFDSDPKLNPDARFIERASYQEVREMKEEGRIKGLIHDDALNLLEEKGIVYCIRPTIDPVYPGTVIGA